MHTWCEWLLWGRNCQHLLVSQPLQLNPISPFFPSTAGTSHQDLTSKVISTRLSRIFLVDQLWFLYHPFHWISLWGLEHSGSLCNRGTIHAAVTLDLGLCQNQITRGCGCLQWHHSWNTVVYPDQGLSLEQQWQPVIQYFLVMGNLKYLYTLFLIAFWQCVHFFCTKAKQLQNMNGAGSKVEKTLLELGRGGFLLCLFASGLGHKHGNSSDSLFSLAQAEIVKWHRRQGIFKNTCIINHRILECFVLEVIIKII